MTADRPPRPRPRRESLAERRERRAAVDDPALVLEAAARFLEVRSRSVAEVRRNWQDNAATLRSVVPVAIDSADVDAVEADATRYLAGRGPLFEARIAAGFAIDGHGDLLAEDIFCLEDGPNEEIDCSGNQWTCIAY